MEYPFFKSKGVENRPFQVAQLDSGAGSLRVLGSGPWCGLAVRRHLVLSRLQQPRAPAPPTPGLRRASPTGVLPHRGSAAASRRSSASTPSSACPLFFTWRKKLIKEVA